MHTKNYSRQNWRGQSFVGQDLSGADFSDSDLRGADFTAADLTGARFCRARLGRSLKMTGIVWGLQLLLSLIAGFLAIVGGVFMFWLIDEILKAFHSYSELFIRGLALIAYSLVFAVVLFISLMRQTWTYMLVFWSILTSGAGAGAGAGIIAVAGADADAVTTVAAVAVAVAGAGAVAVAGAGAGAGAIAIAIAGSRARASAVVIAVVVVVVVTLAFVVTVAGTGAGTEARAGTGAGVVAGTIFIILGLYLGYRAGKKEEPPLLWLRHLGIQFNTLGGTQFAFATLHGCDFSHADLKHARFKHAKLRACNFQLAKNAHLALTHTTPLEFKKVRELVIERKRVDSDLSGLNLQGLDFSGLDLQNLNLANANLSFADFSDADLRGADLCEVTALSTRFSRCKLTAACIEHWNIDSATQLDDIDCQFVYLKRDHGERKPPLGETFAAGEFSKLYQQIADTIDFIAHNPQQYEAIISAIDQIKLEGCEGLFVQSIERKDGAVVIRVKAPPEFDRDQVYAQIKQESAVQMQWLEAQHKQALLEKDVDYLQRETALKSKHEDLLAEVLKKTVSPPPVTIHNTVGQDVNTISNSPINNAAVNLGANSTVTHTIEQLPEQFSELKTLLTALQTSILASRMPESDKQQAVQHAQNLAGAATQPATERLVLVKNTCRWFKGLAEDLKDLPETAAQIGETVAKIALLIGM